MKGAKDKILLITHPKTGTHLARIILGFDHDDEGTLLDPDNLFLGRWYPGGVSAHLSWSQEIARKTRNYHRVTLLRDPRDVIVSWFHYVIKRPNAGINSLFLRIHHDDLMAFMIKTFVCNFENFSRWLDEPDVTVLRYENLLYCPETELKPLVPILNLSLRELVARSRVRKSRSFRKGVTGEWKHDFNECEKLLFDCLYGHIMEKWGYE